VDWSATGRIALAATLAAVPALACRAVGLAGTRYLAAGCTLYCATYAALWWTIARRTASFAVPEDEGARAAA
jgi:hypothetical protein